ncbi:MAG: glycoside hydrolase family 3 N-terminal domain-containing protein [bacterium]|jgi:beta-N-acetylhexosaminidase
MQFEKLDGIQKQWVEDQIQKMSLRQMVGQLFCPMMMKSNLSSNEQIRTFVTQIQGDVQHYCPGGYYLNRYYPRTTPIMLNMLQESSAIPLLICADMEAGAGGGLGGVIAPGLTQFPPAMGIGATGSEHYAYLTARHTALQARALGVNYVFAPSLDVNNNPDNPIINIRSFGENPADVARLGCACIRGLQEHGVIASAKHFPGHGETLEDSHLLLSKVSASRERLDQVELLPFRAAIEEADVLSIMTGHLSVPALEPDEKIPATLSSAVIQGLLREELGYDGLIVTDALLMGAITTQYSPGEAALLALQAGVDWLLMPPEFPIAFEAVYEAAEDGTLSKDRLYKSLLRILSLKARLGLHENYHVQEDEVFLMEEQENSEAQSFAICSDAVTLVKNENHLLPLSVDQNISVLTLFDQDDEFSDKGSAFHEMVAGYSPETRYLRLLPDATESKIAQARRIIDAADTVILGLVIRTLPEKGTVDIPEPFARLVEFALQDERNVILVSFGNPYLLRRFPSVQAYLCAYSYFDLMTEAVADVIFGKRIPHGHLPVTIPGICERGTGCTY